MRVLIAGASGAIGRPLVLRLRANRHEVFALARSPDSAPALKDIGAEAIVADALDSAAVKAAVGRIRPDAVINHTETKRFEVDGADAAREFLRGHGIAQPKAELVWEAIALHATPGIPQYMRPEIALTNAGVLVDVVGIGYDEYTPEQRDQVIAAFPRGDFKNDFLQMQTASALKKPQTTFGTVNFDYIEDHDPTFRKPNACTRIRNTPWQT
jgi:NAD(P)-dependent dehydrogenase (short-subunit alcohol dehydrogenase family)